MNRFAPSTDPSLIIRFYERTPEQQASLGYLVDPSHLEDHRDGASAEEMGGASDEVRREPHGSVGATAAHRAIAHSDSADIAETMFKYSAPEEVMLSLVSVDQTLAYISQHRCLLLFDRL